jgi:hypothetical protein
MSKQYTYKQTANDFQLWMEYVDPHATMTQEEFDQMTTEEKIEMQVEIWGEEEDSDEEAE